MVLQPLFDAYGNQFVEFREHLFKAANRYIGYQITPDENNAFIIVNYVPQQNGYFPLLQFVGRLHFYRMQMAGPASDAFSENPYQGYWELETNYAINQPVYIPDPNGKIIKAIYESAENKRNIGVYRRPHSPTAECRGCNISGGKHKKGNKKSKRYMKKSTRNKRTKKRQTKTKKRIVKK
jgi:hypothetical protein